jgi:hypothetical protein
MSSPETTPPAEYPPPPPTTVVAPAVVPPAPRPLKSPGAAMLLSLLMPGLGQFYNGHLSKAVFFFFAFTGTIYLVVESNPLPFAFFLPFIFFSNMIDAYRSATLINARGTAQVMEEDDVESPGWGIGLAGVGLLLFLNNMGWLRLSALVPYWPLLLIAAGVVLLRRSMQRKAGDGTSV